MKRLLALFWVILLPATLCNAQQDFQISLQNNTDKELQKKNQLESLLKQYNLSKWILTRKVVIDEKAIPHSHPVLTLNTRGLSDDFAALSTFVHEEIHWFEEANSLQRDRAIAELRTIYPDAPSGPPEGARDQYSTYLHLIVCYLEYEAMKELVGNERAREVIEASSKFLYKWIYRTVLSDGPKIKAVLEKHKLRI